MTARILVRGGTAAEWTSANPILAARELGAERDTGKLKVGDGVTAWTSLAYSTPTYTAFTASLLDDTTAAAARTTLGLSTLATATTLPAELCIAVGDETTAITVGTAKVTFRMPFAMTVTAVRASLTTASSSGTPTVDINEGAGAGTSILSTKLTIDATELTSTTAATAAVISDASLADDAQITIDVDVAGTNAAGLKVWLLGTRAA